MTWKSIIGIRYKHNYKDIVDNYYFKNLNPNLKHKLVEVIIEPEQIFFNHLFSDTMSQRTVNCILQNLKSCYYAPGTSIIKAKDEFKNFFLIKKGHVNCFDKSYNYLNTLEQGSFFGEFNIIFQLYSFVYYQSSGIDIEGCTIYKIDYEKFINIICKDVSAFKHLFDISL